METKTLTIEHIAPYLPYGIRMINTKSGRIIDVRGLRATVSTFIIEATVKSDNGINDVEYQSDLWRLKPILRPLCDLHKPVNYKGSEIIPANYLYRKYDITDMEFNGGVTDPKYGYEIYVFLFENHFDVFGLIDAGLSIDINTISHE